MVLGAESNNGENTGLGDSECPSGAGISCLSDRGRVRLGAELPGAGVRMSGCAQAGWPALDLISSDLWEPASWGAASDLNSLPFPSNSRCITQHSAPTDTLSPHPHGSPRESTDFVAREPGFESQLCHVLAGRHWANHSSLCLSFLSVRRIQ